MILGKEPVTLAETLDIIKDLEEKEEIKSYLKRFAKTDKKQALEIKEEIKKLNNLKLKEENIVKIADFLPKKSEELNKILTEVTLTEEETNAILDIVKKY